MPLNIDCAPTCFQYRILTGSPGAPACFPSVWQTVPMHLTHKVSTSLAPKNSSHTFWELISLLQFQVLSPQFFPSSSCFATCHFPLPPSLEPVTSQTTPQSHGCSNWKAEIFLWPGFSWKAVIGYAKIRNLLLSSIQSLLMPSQYPLVVTCWLLRS